LIGAVVVARKKKSGQGEDKKEGDSGPNQSLKKE